MRIYNSNNIIRYKNNYYCKVKIKTVNIQFKYLTKSPILVVEDEPYILGEPVCLFQTDNKDTRGTCTILEYEGQDEHLLNKFVPYNIPDSLSNLHDTNEIQDFNVLLIKAKKVFGLYFIDEQDDNIIFESTFKDFHKIETKFEKWFYNFKEKYFI